jgi:hypothetical protein
MPRQLADFEADVERAVSLTKGDAGASTVLIAVVEEFGRKMQKALKSNGDMRESVVEVEQAADSAKYAAEADSGLSDDAKNAIIAAHDSICVLKSKMDKQS